MLDVRRTLLRFVLSLLVVAFAAELALRALLPPQLGLQTFLSPGAHMPNERYGFVFSPDYSGSMYNDDGVFDARITTDAHGFRVSASTAAPSTSLDRPPEVVLVGGQSMMWGAGLPDDETMPFMMTAAAPCRMKVYNAAWPGFDIYRMYHAYLDFLEPSIHPRVVVLSLYTEVTQTPERFAQLPDDFEALPPHPPREELFYYRDDLVVPRTGTVCRALGRWYYRSFLLARLAAAADMVLSYGPDKLAGLRGAVGRAFGHRDAGARTAASRADQLRPDEDEGLRKAAAFIETVNEHVGQRGARLMVVFLPIVTSPPALPAQAARFRVVRDRIQQRLPASIPVIDMFSEFTPSFRREDSIAYGHYGAMQNRLLGHRLAEEVCKVLGDTGAPSDRGVPGEAGANVPPAGP
jgi:hypothetical protein